jgi:hypothetical protein
MGKALPTTLGEEHSVGRGPNLFISSLGVNVMILRNIFAEKCVENSCVLYSK